MTPDRPRVLVPWPQDAETTVGRLVSELAVEVERALERAGADVVRLDATATAEDRRSALAGCRGRRAGRRW